MACCVSGRTASHILLSSTLLLWAVDALLDRYTLRMSPWLELGVIVSCSISLFRMRWVLHAIEWEETHALLVLHVRRTLPRDHH